jgi:MOSC domain-containing protein YiiM
MSLNLRHLTSLWPHRGRLDTILLRPARDEPALLVDAATVIAGRGLQGDRTAEKQPPAMGGGKRQVTLLQAEHLPLIAAWAGLPDVDARLLRRNLVVSGLNLLAARSPFSDQRVHLHLGEEVVLELTGPCDPCSKMEAALGPGGYNAMRGHGGLTARVLQGGRLCRGDAVWASLAPRTEPLSAHH